MKRLVFFLLLITACGKTPTAAPPMVGASPSPPNASPTPNPTPVSSPTPIPTPSPTPVLTPTPTPGSLNCFQGVDENGYPLVFCTGGNLGFTIAQLENFGWPTTYIVTAEINNNANPQPVPIIVCVTEQLYDIPHALIWTAKMCGNIYDTTTNTLTGVQP